jgi:tRNA(Ile)-lysidine synthase
LDSTNLDPSLTRNRIRHQLLPLLREQYNPRIAQRLAHLAEQAAAAVRLQLRRVRQLLRRCEKPRAASVIVLDWDALRESTTFPEVREVFRWLWEREHWPLGELDQLRLDQLAELVHGSSKAVDLPGGIRAVRQGKVVKLWREAKRLPKSTQ